MDDFKLGKDEIFAISSSPVLGPNYPSIECMLADKAGTA